MFDFERLRVYQKALVFNKAILSFLKQKSIIDIYLQNQLKRASLSILANIAEGSARFGKADKNRFYVISRASAFEVIAHLSVIFDNYPLDKAIYLDFRNQIADITTMIYAMIEKSVGKEQP